MTDGPLRGVKVLEFSQIIAGPTAGIMLADLGADVVKVEPPGGEGSRRLGATRPGLSKGFQWLNRGKRSLVLDLEQAAARKVVHRIIPSFDVVITNYRPSIVKRLEIDYDTLSKIRKDLVYGEISGFGRTGPLVGGALIELAAQAYSGYMVESGGVDDFGNPHGTLPSVTDMATGLTTVIGVVSALYHRRETGEGQLVAGSLLRTAMGFVGGSVIKDLVNDPAGSPSGVAEPRQRLADGADYASVLQAYKRSGAALAAFYQPFISAYMAKDGPVFIGAFTARMRASVRETLGIPDDGSDGPGFNPLDAASVAGAARTKQELIRVIHSKSIAELVSQVQALGVPVAPVHFPGELADDPQASHYMVTLEDELTGPQKQLSGWFEMSKTEVRAAGPAPGLGRHTDEVLMELGLSADELAELRRTGAVE